MKVLDCNAGMAAQRADELFHSGWNCAESVFQAVYEQVCDGEAPVHLLTALGGGMASKRTCGALSGAIVALGLGYGRKEPSEAAKKAAYASARDLYKAFRDKFHSTECWELTCECENDEARKQSCTRLVRTAAELACHLLAKRVSRTASGDGTAPYAASQA
jgi:C_GCAxxG_C_C family probable redox protein